MIKLIGWLCEAAVATAIIGAAIIIALLAVNPQILETAIAAMWGSQ